MIAIVHSIYSQSVHAPASHARLMDNEAERYCTSFWRSDIFLFQGFAVNCLMISCVIWILY